MRSAPSVIVRIVAPLVLVATSITSCGDGTPAFCSDLAGSQNLDGVVAALKTNNFAKAKSEANRLKDLAAEAPGEIRADLLELADGVIDIIDLVERDQDANSVSEEDQSGPEAGSGQAGNDLNSGPEADGQATEDGTNQAADDDTQADVTVTTQATAEPTDVEQRRNELNARLGKLDKRSENVGNWALQECGIEL